MFWLPCIKCQKCIMTTGKLASVPFFTNHIHILCLKFQRSCRELMTLLPGCFINPSHLHSQQSVEMLHLNSNYASCHLIKITLIDIATSPEKKSLFSPHYFLKAMPYAASPKLSSHTTHRQYTPLKKWQFYPEDVHLENLM